MSKGVDIEVKFYHQQTIALYGAHLWLLDNFDIVDDYDQVLFQYLNCTFLTLAQKVRAYDDVRANNLGKKFWKMVLKPYEALMFCVIWGNVSVPDPLGNVVVLELVKKIDQRAKSQRVLNK